MRKGQLHILALSTGAVPGAVNAGGFVPRFVMADDEGKWGYQMEIIVPSDSQIKELKDLKGVGLNQTPPLVLNSASSLSTFKAPLVLLWKEHGLLVRRDYDYRQAATLRDSVAGVCAREYQAAAVSNDFLKRVLAQAKAEKDSKIDETKFRSIYKSPTYPPACFGYSYKLKKELADRIDEAFATFTFKGTGLEEEFKAANQTRFARIDYKKDWEPVRKIDEGMAELVEQKP
jgi:phosphonate transport system substrate-binding protein